MASEPLPETPRALQEWACSPGCELSTELARRVECARAVVPSLVGASLAVVRHGVTYTVASTHHQLAVLDGVQYAVGGPCVDAAMQDAMVLSGDQGRGLFDEERWPEFARVGAAHGVLSTLSLPIHDGSDAPGGLNLYAASPRAFEGRCESLGVVMGVCALGALLDGLTPGVRVPVGQAAPLLEEMAILHQATGVVMAAHAVDQVDAREILAGAARRAGQDSLDVAQALVRPFGNRQAHPG